MAGIGGSSPLPEEFRPLYARANASNPDVLKLVAVLDAVKATISGTGSYPSADDAPPTAYFAALMVALERAGAEHAKEVFYLLSIVLAHVPPPVLRAKYDAVSALFTGALRAPAVLKDQTAMKSLLKGMGHVLAAQEPSDETWARPAVAQAMSALLHLTIEPRPKVRKAAQAAVLDILQSLHSSKSRAAGPVVSNYFCGLLKGASQKDVTAILQSGPLLSAALPLLGTTDVAGVVEMLLKLPAVGNARLTALAHGCLGTLLESPRARLTITFAVRLVEALVAAVPSPDEPVSAGDWAFTLTAALTRLANMELVKAGRPRDISLAFPRTPAAADLTAGGPILKHTHALLPAVVSALLSNFQSSRVAVQQATANSLALLLATCVDDACLGAALTYAQANPACVSPTAPGVSRPALPPAAPALLHVIVALEGLYQFKYQASWTHSLPLLALLYRILGPASHPLLQSITFALGELRNQLHAAAEAAAELQRDSDEEDEDEEEDEEGPARKRRKVMRGGPQTAAARAKAARRRGDAGSSDEEGAAAGPRRGGHDGTKTPTAAAVYRVVLKVLAAAVRAMGADCFLRTIGLVTPGAPPTALPETAAWVLPLLRDNAAFAPAPLALFGNVLYPIIKGAETAAAAATAAGMSGPAFLQRARILQCWSILPALMVAPPDFTTAFGVPLGKTLVAALQDTAKWGDLIPFICRALETAVVRARAAAGMTPVDFGRGDASTLLDDGDEEDGAGGADDGLTIAGGGKAGGRRGGEEDSDDDEELPDDDGEADASASRRGGGGGGDDGATAVFGAGGVSVYAGGGEGGSDPRHPLIAASISPTARDRKLPPLTKEAGEAMVRTLSAFAKNYVPVLFSTYEAIVLAAGGVLTGATQDRARKLLDATAAYLSVAPADLHVMVAERLLKFLGDARTAHGVALANLKAARDAEKAGAASAVSKTGATKAAQGAAAKVNALLSLAQIVVPALAGALGDEYTSSALPVPAPAPVRTQLASCVDRLYAGVLPMLAGDAPQATQKRAYAVLASLLTHHSATLVTGNPARRSELLGLLHGSLLVVAPSVRRWRLHCLRHLLRGLDVGVPEHLAVVPAMLGEVMLCTKDTNNKVRGAAFELLVGMARLMHRGGDGDGGESWEAPVLPDDDDDEAEEGGAKKGSKRGMDDDDDDDDDDEEELETGAGGMEDEEEEDEEDEDFVDVAGAAGGVAPGALIPVANPTLTEFFRMALAGLLSATPHMRSAGVLCLGRLVYEFSNEAVLHAMLPHILHSVLILSKEKAREVIKSVVGFAKVVVSCMPPATTRPYARVIIRSLMVWSGESKNRIRTKIRGVLERMVRKLGWEAVVPYVPAKDQKLIAHMRKEHERRERKRAAAAAAAGGAGEAGADGATAVSRARTAFDVMAGLGGGGGSEDGSEFDDEDEDEYRGGGGDDDDGASLGGATKLTAAEAASVAKSWGVARAGGSGGSVTGRGSLMTAVTMDARKAFRSLMAAPLPPPGSALPAPVKAAKKAATVVSARTGASGTSRRTGAAAPAAAFSSAAPSSMLRADDDTPLDLLDASAMRGVVGSDPATLAALQRQRKAAERADAARKSGKLGGGIVVGPDGRLIIPDVDDDDKRKGGDDEADPTALKVGDPKSSAALRRSMKRRAGRGDHGDADDDDDEGGGRGGAKKGGGHSTAVGAQGWGQAKSRDFSKRKDGGADRFSGKQFRSNKAAGDVHRKGAKFEPFAYVPLDPRAASGGGGDAAISRFSSVVASTSKAERAKLKRAEAAAAATTSAAAASGERLAGTKRRRD